MNPVRVSRELAVGRSNEVPQARLVSLRRPADGLHLLQAEERCLYPLVSDKLSRPLGALTIIL